MHMHFGPGVQILGHDRRLPSDPIEPTRRSKKSCAESARNAQLANHHRCCRSHQVIGPSLGLQEMVDHIVTVLWNARIAIVFESPQAPDDRFDAVPIRRIRCQSTEDFVSKLLDFGRWLLVHTDKTGVGTNPIMQSMGRILIFCLLMMRELCIGRLRYSQRMQLRDLVKLMDHRQLRHIIAVGHHQLAIVHPTVEVDLVDSIDMQVRRERWGDQSWRLKIDDLRRQPLTHRIDQFRRRKLNLHPRLFLDRNHRRIAVGLRVEQILRMRPDAVLEMIERLDSQPLRCLTDQIRDRSRVGPLGLILLVVGLRLANRRKLLAVLFALGRFPLGLLDLVVERYRSRITPLFRSRLAIEVRNQIVHRGDLGFQKQIAIDRPKGKRLVLGSNQHVPIADPLASPTLPLTVATRGRHPSIESIRRVLGNTIPCEKPQSTESENSQNR